MKHFVLFIFLLAGPTFAAPLDCKHLEDRINNLQDKNHKSGKLKNIEARRNQISIYEDQLYKCKNTQKIEVVNNPSKNVKNDHQKLRTTKNDSPQAQKLLKTCNYWINENNKNPSVDNSTYRDTACRALDDMEHSSTRTQSSTISTNTLKDCIKPNNIIDIEVTDCMKGNRRASWKK